MKDKKDDKTREDNIIKQVMLIKSMTVYILTYQKGRLTVVESKTIKGIYELMDEILLGKIHSPRYTMEEYVDAKLVEYSVLLSKTKNVVVKELYESIDGGIVW